jgi:hypothetical protein
MVIHRSNDLRLTDLTGTRVDQADPTDDVDPHNCIGPGRSQRRYDDFGRFRGRDRSSPCRARIRSIVRSDGTTRPSIGLRSSVFTVSPDATVRDPIPSPDGRSIAYLSQPCTNAYATAVVVRSLSSQREHRISAVDGWVWHPGWSPDSRQIIFTVRFSVYRGPADRAAFAVVPSDASIQVPRSALKHAPTPNCSVLQATFDAAGLALLEGCPDDLGAGWLTQLDPPTRQHSLWRSRTRLCPNGATIVANRPGTDLLLTATTHCGGVDPMVDVVQTWSGPQPHEVGRYTNGQQFVFAAAW